MKIEKKKLLLLVKKLGIIILALLFILIFTSENGEGDLGSLRNPIIDSDMTLTDALDGVSDSCPESIMRRLRLVTVIYYSFDNKIHQGQILLDISLADDAQYVFKKALAVQFPIKSVIPISAMQFRKNGQWDDNLSMSQNNTSAFNYRIITGGHKLSNHSFGTAIDINPIQNPYIKGKTILPERSVYNINARGTLVANDVVVKAFIERGWTWGGYWDSLKDYQHFEKEISFK